MNDQPNCLALNILNLKQNSTVIRTLFVPFLWMYAAMRQILCDPRYTKVSNWKKTFQWLSNILKRYFKRNEIIKTSKSTIHHHRAVYCTGRDNTTKGTISIHNTELWLCCMGFGQITKRGLVVSSDSYPVYTVKY